MDDRWKAEAFQLFCNFVVVLREEPDADYVHVSQSTEDGELDRDMEEGPSTPSDYQSPRVPGYHARSSSAAGSPPDAASAADSSPASAAAAASPPAAAAASSSGAHDYGLRRPVGPPPRKAVAGAAGQKVARDAARLQHGHKPGEAVELLDEHLREEGPTITDEYAQRQAKACANSLYATAGGLGNAVKVFERLAMLPEIRVIAEYIQSPKVRCSPAAPSLAPYHHNISYSLIYNVAHALPPLPARPSCTSALSSTSSASSRAT